MIDPKQLRIGNLVTIDNEEYWPEMEGIWLKVTGISDLTQWNDDFDKSTHSISLEWSHNSQTGTPRMFSQFNQYVSPIPLTDEVLIRAGASMVKNHRGSYCSFVINSNTYIAKNPDGFYLVIQRTDANEECGDEEYYTELKVDYLHTLQNLKHCLTGTELEIK